eukprot:scaffold71725_cov84-Phaeocystis_antarctica.AAC.7
MAPLSTMACLWASSVRSSAKETVWMQSTGQQSRASSTTSASSPTCWKTRAAPKSSSILKVLRASSEQ